MSFPTPAPVKVYIAPGGEPADRDTWSWQDITSYVRGEMGIRIERGRRDEGTRVGPSECSMVLDNTDGRFASRNPLGAYYPDLKRGTPLRVAWQVDTDTFTTTVADAWGSTTRGLAWSTAGSGGTVDAADFDVASGEGIHHVETTSAYRRTYLPDLAAGDMDVTVTLRLSFTDVTGGSLTAGVMLRVQPSAASYYAAHVAISTAEAVTLSLVRTTTVISSGHATGLTHAAAQSIKIRAQVVNQKIRAKAWAASADEPAAWQAEAVDDGSTAIREPGGAGVESFVGGGNSNTKPVDFFYDNFAVECDRFIGFITELPPRWNPEGSADAHVPVRASGPLRRLGQGAQPLLSPLRRAVPTYAPDVVAYWPMEDDNPGPHWSSGLPSGSKMRITEGGGLQPASVEGPGGSGPLAAFGVGSGFYANVPTFTIADDGWRVDWLFRQETAASLNNMRIHTKGSPIATWVIRHSTTNVHLDGYDGEENVDYTVADALDSAEFFGDWLRFAFLVHNDGSNLVYQLQVFKPDGSDPVTLHNFGTTAVAGAGSSPGRVTKVGLVAPMSTDGRSWGHLAVSSDRTVDAYQNNADDGYQDELATERIERLCNEEGVYIALREATDTTLAAPPLMMHEQARATLLGLLYDAEDTDGGLLYESDGGLAYAAKSARYNQTPRLVLTDELPDPPEPTDDDQRLANDVTAQRGDGIFARATDDESITAHGRYEEALTVSPADEAALPWIAGWRLHLGTVDEYRWPRIVVYLQRNPELIMDWLSMRLGELITYTPTLDQLPGLSPDLLVDGYTETIHAFGWEIELHSVPGSPWAIAVADTAKVDTAGSELDADFDAGTDTSMSVDITSGPLWTTDAGEMPIVIECGGCVLTVSAISGASSPQTFTVSATVVNGVEKTIPAGTAVRLAQPATVAL